MFWKECNEPTFYKHNCQPDNFLYLNGKNIIHPHIAEIVGNILDVVNLDRVKTTTTTTTTTKNKKKPATEHEDISVCLFYSLPGSLHFC